MKNPVKVVGYLALCAWLGGAVIAGFYYCFDQRRTCIQNEGWLKGWFWCSTENRNTYVFNMLRGLVWPLELTASRRFEASPDHSGAVAAPGLDRAANAHLTREQKALVQQRCAEAIEAHERRNPGIPGMNPKLCTLSHESAALKGEPSYLTMSPDDFAYYRLNHSLTPKEQETMLKEYGEIMSTCEKVITKAMIVQPLVKQNEKLAVSVDAEKMAVLVIEWSPKIPKTDSFLYVVPLIAHFREAGVYGQTPDYFLTAYDSCVSFSESFSAIREKDRRSQPVVRINNKHRADLTETFSVIHSALER